MKKPRSIVIFGRRWFDRRNGNTYHSATALVDGEVKAHIDFAYGYGDQYYYNAFAALEKDQVVPARPENIVPPWQWCEDLGIKLYYEAADVARRRDL